MVCIARIYVMHKLSTFYAQRARARLQTCIKRKSGLGPKPYVSDTLCVEQGCAGNNHSVCTRSALHSDVVPTSVL